MMKKLVLTLFVISLISCSSEKNSKINTLKDNNYEYKNYAPTGNEIIVSRDDYFNKLKGFWLAQVPANSPSFFTQILIAIPAKAIKSNTKENRNSSIN